MALLTGKISMVLMWGPSLFLRTTFCQSSHFANNNSNTHSYLNTLQAKVAHVAVIYEGTFVSIKTKTKLDSQIFLLFTNKYKRIDLEVHKKVSHKSTQFEYKVFRWISCDYECFLVFLFVSFYKSISKR